MPSMFGKESRKNELIENLRDVYKEIQMTHNISSGDFPNIRKMQQQLAYYDFTKFHSLKQKLLDNVDRMLSEDITKVMKMIPQETEDMKDTGNIEGGAFEGYTESPFGFGRGEGVDAGRDESGWIVSHERSKSDETFRQLNPIDGKLLGSVAKAEMVKSKLPNSVLGKIWKLSDINCDGMLDEDEWALVNYLIGIKLEGYDLPNELPDHLIPPSKRNLFPE